VKEKQVERTLFGKMWMGKENQAGSPYWEQMGKKSVGEELGMDERTGENRR
jgi:hypothetical protein